MKTALVIMAAGLGSRFGAGIKQLAKVDEYGHIIMDYSVHDAIKAGFNKIVFVIRKDLEKDFSEVIGDRIKEIASAHNVEVAYAFQEKDDLPEGIVIPEGRTKPWGTAHAVLAARHEIDMPFAVINADDYYGKEAFIKVHDELIRGNDECCMAGFLLGNTLSENGGVTRGVCAVTNDYLTDIMETGNITKDSGIPLDSLVSMNMWGCPAKFMTTLWEEFRTFFETIKDPMKSEYLLPIILGDLLKADRVRIKVLKTKDTWYGMTYQEDVPAVQKSFSELIASGEYKCDLYGDL